MGTIVWGLWAFPLLVILFLGGATAGLAWFMVTRKGQRRIAIPFACISIFVVGLAMLAVVSNLLQSSDTELFEEVFG